MAACAALSFGCGSDSAEADAGGDSALADGAHGDSSDDVADLRVEDDASGDGALGDDDATREDAIDDSDVSDDARVEVDATGDVSDETDAQVDTSDDTSDDVKPETSDALSEETSAEVGVDAAPDAVQDGVEDLAPTDSSVATDGADSPATLEVVSGDAADDALVDSALDTALAPDTMTEVALDAGSDAGPEITVDTATAGAEVDAAPTCLDRDGDGYGIGRACPIEDCDDTDRARHPGAFERCDGIDNNCDGTVDESSAIDARPWHPDRDRDGFGDKFLIIMSCTALPGTLADGSDCDDGSALARPGGTEVCDGRDNDCDGTTDEDDALDTATWFRDDDHDGHGLASATRRACTRPAGYAAASGDCDDGDATRYPGAPEYCDHVDHDCDGATDEHASVDAPSWYADEDNDGYGDPLVLRRSCAPIPGYVSDASDCDDQATAVNPAATELCDGVDNDCDDGTDEDDAADALTWYADSDEDDYGDASVVRIACDAPDGYVADATDCDDGDDAVHPNAPEYCDGVDLDCDELVDQSDSIDAGTWYIDADRDGFGGPTALRACSQPAGTVADTTDCDDLRASVHPGAPEICNGRDDDCEPATRDDALRPPTARSPVPVGGFAGRQLRGAELACLNLAGVSFVDADLRGADLRRADLRGADFSGANLRWADLEGADLRGASFFRADLDGASFRHAHRDP